MPNITVKGQKVKVVKEVTFDVINKVKEAQGIHKFKVFQKGKPVNTPKALKPNLDTEITPTDWGGHC